MKQKIYQWNDISSEFGENLIVGNGGSIAVDQKSFSYSSLYKRAGKRGFINEDVKLVFDEFSKEYRDFEFVMGNLLVADHVNKCLDKEYNRRKNDVRKAYLDVRGSLIKTVRDTHPSTDETWSKLERVGFFVMHFKNIFYLNYDLLLYWATLSQSTKSTHKFSDSFKALVSDEASDGHSLWEMHGDFKQSNETSNTKIYYPHGSLMLYRTKVGNLERKISLPTANQLEKLEKFWRENEATPLFICEGSTLEKTRRISRSKYLSMVLDDALPSINKSLVIYGWSLGSQDKHIIEKLQGTPLQKVAVSIHKGDKSCSKIADEMNTVHSRLASIKPGIDVLFFDAQSPGCWCH